MVHKRCVGGGGTLSVRRAVLPFGEPCVALQGVRLVAACAVTFVAYVGVVGLGAYGMTRAAEQSGWVEPDEFLSAFLSTFLTLAVAVNLGLSLGARSSEQTLPLQGISLVAAYTATFVAYVGVVGLGAYGMTWAAEQSGWVEPDKFVSAFLSSFLTLAVAVNWGLESRRTVVHALARTECLRFSVGLAFPTSAST